MARLRIPRENTAYLSLKTERRVRFEEVDALQMMWHGRYASWFEDGRESIGRVYGISYLDFLEHGVLVPIKLMYIDYLQPLVYNQSYQIETRLLCTEAICLEFDYLILNSENLVMTKACTSQLLLDKNKNLLLDWPVFFKKFKAEWKKHENSGSNSSL